MEKRIEDALRDIVGAEHFTTHVIDLVSYAQDASEHKHRPEAAVWPVNTAEVSAILKLANRERFPVVPRGAGTSLAGLAVPEKGGLVMDMVRMNRIIEISIEDRITVVQPGVVYADLDRALAVYGFFFPPDPASGKACTLGGNVATNAGGIKGAKYGTTKDYVLALEVVLADGRILRTGSRCMKSVSGYDLTRLFVGSEGTLGVVTEITLKIAPRPPRASAAMATFENVEDAGRAVSEIMHSGIIPSALEFVDRQFLEAIKKHTAMEFPAGELMLVAETDGYTAEETEYQMARIVEIFNKSHATGVRLARTQEEAQSVWAARKAAGGIAAKIKTNFYVEDLSVPISRIPKMLRIIWDIAEKYDLTIPTVGHAGDGNLHPVIIIDGTNPDEVRRMEEASAELLGKVVELGGTLTGEHGIGLSKAPFMGLEHSEVAMEVMRSVKRTLDPNNILNPGKMGLN
jgi:glycolate oxidase